MNKTIGELTRAWADEIELAYDYARQIPSTNDAAKETPQTGKFLFVAEHQTSGRGRGTNTWSDGNTGSGLLSSWCFDLNGSAQPIAAPVVGLALYRSCAETWPSLEWSLKAPNDLYITNKKVAGLLIETVSTGNRHRFIVGLGFNIVNNPEVGNAGNLSEFLNAPLKDEIWKKFLSSWWLNIQSALSMVIRPTIGAETASELLAALNRNPLLTKKYDQVLPDGSLRIGEKQISWTSL